MNGKMKRSDGKEYEINLNDPIINYGSLRGTKGLEVKTYKDGITNVEISVSNETIHFYCKAEKFYRFSRLENLDCFNCWIEEDMAYFHIIFRNSEIILSYNVRIKETISMYKEHLKLFQKHLKLSDSCLQLIEK